MSTDTRRSATVGAGFGYGLLVGTLCCALCAVPGALRASAAGASLPLAWLALFGAAALMVGPVAGAWRVARPLPPSAWCVPLGVALSLPPLLVFARVLKVATHHRPLGAATFAIVAALVVLGATAFGARAIAWAGRRSGAMAHAPLLLAVLALLLATPLVLPALGPELRGSSLDGVLCLFAVATGALLPEHRALQALSGRIGPVVWLAAVGLAMVVGLGTAEIRAVLAERAPVLLGLAGWLRP